MIKAVTFDCWDTLLIDDHSQNPRMAHHLQLVFHETGISISDKEIAHAFSEENTLREEYVITHQKTQNAIQRTETLLALLGVQLSIPEVVQIANYFDQVAIECLPKKVPGVSDLLKRLSRNYPLGVICNTGFHSGKTLREIFEAHELLKEFAWLSFSDEVGVAKPHRHIFDLTARRLGCRPENSVHIGDSEYTDVAGAKNARMKAILFTGIKKNHKNNTSADFTIDNYSDLLSILENL